MQVPVEYPHELFIPFSSNDYLLGRLTVNLICDKFQVDIDIVLKESKKIYRHVDRIYQKDDYAEAVDSAMQNLAHFLASAPIS